MDQFVKISVIASRRCFSCGVAISVLCLALLLLVIEKCSRPPKPANLITYQYHHPSLLSAKTCHICLPLQVCIAMGILFRRELWGKNICCKDKTLSGESKNVQSKNSKNKRKIAINQLKEPLIIISTKLLEYFGRVVI